LLTALFQSVLTATGGLKGFAFGREGAGVVRRVGSKVDKVHVGDRVLFCRPDASSTTLTINQRLCEKIPEDLSFVDAATLPLAYATAIHSLLRVGRLEKGQVR
jgi:NADPH:quinone reductase-like Zn-dependent oxidoreductase